MPTPAVEPLLHLLDDSLGEKSQVAAAAPTPTVTATPHSNIHDGDAVVVTATGFSPDIDLVLGQCGPEITSIADCDTNNSKFLKSDAQGSATATIKAIVGPVGTA